MNKVVVIAALLISSVIFLPGCIRIGENLPPEPDLKATATFIDVNETVIFSANDSFDRDGKISKYYWDFGDGTNATTPYASHDYEKGGNYTVVLIITDNEGKKAVQAMTIHVNELPVPVIKISHPVFIHETVYFWANDSHDPDGYVMDYFWDFGDGANETGMSVTHVYTLKDTYKVTLTVKDNDDAKAASSREFEVRFRTYLVTWVTDSIELPETSGYAIERESEYFVENINVLNLTKVKFDLTWDDNIPIVGDPNDEFMMNVTSPEGEIYEGGPSMSEQISIFAPNSGTINPIPQEMQIDAESPEILEILLANNHTTTGGIGEWAINITLTEANGFINGVADNSNEWELKVVCFYYSPIITKL